MSPRLLATDLQSETSTLLVTRISDGHFVRIKTLMDEVGRPAAKEYIRTHIFDRLGTDPRRIGEVTIVRDGVDPWRGTSPMFRLTATLI